MVTRQFAFILLLFSHYHLSLVFFNTVLTLPPFGVDLFLLGNIGELLSFQIDLFISKSDQKKKKKPRVFPLLVQFPKAHRSWSWARGKPGARSSIQVSLVKAGTPALGP